MVVNQHLLYSSAEGVYKEKLHLIYLDFLTLFFSSSYSSDPELLEEASWFSMNLNSPPALYGVLSTTIKNIVQVCLV